MKRTRKQRQQERAQTVRATNVPAKAETPASAQAAQPETPSLVRCEVAGRAELSTVRAELVGLKVV